MACISKQGRTDNDTCKSQTPVGWNYVTVTLKRARPRRTYIHTGSCTSMMHEYHQHA